MGYFFASGAKSPLKRGARHQIGSCYKGAGRFFVLLIPRKQPHWCHFICASGCPQATALAPFLSVLQVAHKQPHWRHFYLCFRLPTSIRADAILSVLQVAQSNRTGAMSLIQKQGELLLRMERWYFLMLGACIFGQETAVAGFFLKTCDSYIVLVAVVFRLIRAFNFYSDIISLFF